MARPTASPYDEPNQPKRRTSISAGDPGGTGGNQTTPFTPSPSFSPTGGDRSTPSPDFFPAGDVSPGFAPQPQQPAPVRDYLPSAPPQDYLPPQDFIPPQGTPYDDGGSAIDIDARQPPVPYDNGGSLTPIDNLGGPVDPWANVPYPDDFFPPGTNGPNFNKYPNGGGPDLSGLNVPGMLPWGSPATIGWGMNPTQARPGLAPMGRADSPMDMQSLIRAALLGRMGG